MAPSDLTPLSDMTGLLEQALSRSPADATEIGWIEARRAQDGLGRRRREPWSGHERTVLVRVRVGGRTGLHRTGGTTPSDLENAVRDALAQARLAPRSAAEPLPGAAAPGAGNGPSAAGATGATGAAGALVTHTDPGAGSAPLCDPELAAMDPAGTGDWLERQSQQRGAQPGEAAQLTWAHGRVALVNSAGLRRAVEVTAAALEIGCGRGPGAGRAVAAARRLAGLDAPALVERARRWQAPAEEPDGAPVPDRCAVVLSHQGAAALVELLNRCALSSASFHDGSSALRGNLGNQVFDSGVSLRDDGTDPRGLPFPFDLAGWAKRPVELIGRGTFLTPAVDPRLADELGRSPTPHRVAPDEARPSHLFLYAADGGSTEEELLAAAAGGIWIGTLDRLECFDRHALRFRALARGVRRIVGGAGGREGAAALGPALPDLVWEDRLPALLSRVLGIGAEPCVVPTGDLLFGATSAPLLALSAQGTFVQAAPPA
ncbi:MAG TPA: metallopeptidase TldD-related protein [Thermoanaerobaculia bacterium]|nr:metallopeptidase TldD-related protein [Thermoanaerobaculia bacterium]